MSDNTTPVQTSVSSVMPDVASAHQTCVIVTQKFDTTSCTEDITNKAKKYFSKTRRIHRLHRKLYWDYAKVTPSHARLEAGR